MSLNSVVLMGRLTEIPELKTTPSGISVTSFSIAVDKKYQPQGEERQAYFIPIVAWRNHAEFITKYFRKGQMIGIEGEIQTRKYQDKNGNNRTAFEVIVNHVTFCGSKSESNNTNTNVGIAVDPQNDPLPAFVDRLNNEFPELSDADQEDLPF